MAELTSKDIKDLRDAMNVLNSSIKSSGGASLRSSGGASSRQKTSQNKNIKDLVNNLKDVNRLTEIQSKGFIDIISSTKTASSQLKMMAGQIYNNTNAYKESAKNSLLHSQALLESEYTNSKTYEKIVRNFQDSANSLGINLNTVNSDYADSVRGVIDYQSDLFSVSSSVAEHIKNLGGDLNRLGSDQIANLIDDFKNLGLDTKHLEQEFNRATDYIETFGGDIYDAFSTVNVGASLKTLANAASNAAVSLNSSTNEIVLKDKSINQFIDEIKRLTGVTKFTLIASFLALGKAFSDFANTLTKLGSRGGATFFGTLLTSSIKMGISYDALAETFMESRRELALIGSKNFESIINTATESLLKFGVAPDEAAKAIPSMTEAFVAIGGSVKDINQYNTSIKEQSQNFGLLSQITGLTAEALAKANSEFLQSSEIQADLLSVNKRERLTKAKEIEKGRDALVMMGLSINEANDIIKRSRALAREDIGSRFKKAARVMQLGAMTGLGSEGIEAARIMQKGLLATPEETVRLNEILGKLNMNTEQAMRQGIASQQLFGAISSEIQGELAGAAKIGIISEADRQINALDKQTNMIGRTNELLIKINSQLGALSSLPGISTGIAALVTIGGTMFAYSKIKGLGGIGNMLGGLAGGVGGAIGKAAPTALKFAKGGLIGAGVMGASALMGEDSTVGKLLNSKTIQGAALGAIFGPIGAAIGGAGGAIWDTIDYINKPKGSIINDVGQSKVSSTATEVNTTNNLSSRAEKTTSDLFDQLKIVNENLTKMLSLSQGHLDIALDQKNAMVGLLSETERESLKSKRVQRTSFNKQELASMPMATQ